MLLLLGAFSLIHTVYRAHTRHVRTVMSIGTYRPTQIKIVALSVTTRETWISLQKTGKDVHCTTSPARVRYCLCCFEPQT